MRYGRAWIAIALLCLPGKGRAQVSAAVEPLGTRVVSLNVAMREDVERVAEELSAVLGAASADVILLQEVAHRRGNEDVAAQLGQRFGMASIFRPAFGTATRSGGLALLTRHPARDIRLFNLPRYDLNFRTRTRIALGATIDTPSGPVHVYNVHLDTRINLDQRLRQLGTVAHDFESRPGPAIVGGDFNTNGNRWLFHTIPLPFLGGQGAGLLRFMLGHGLHSVFGRGHPTHDAFRMQLDWLFLRGLRAAEGTIRPVTLSDHHVLIARVVQDQGAGGQTSTSGLR